MLRCKFLPKGEGISLVGSLDISTAGQLEKLLARYNNGVFKLDFSLLTGLTEDGLRPVLLTARRLKNAGGDLILTNVPAEIREFLDNEGYSFVINVA